MEKLAVHCKTQEEWNKVNATKKIPLDNNWYIHMGESCINANERFYCPKDYYEREGFKIISAEEYLKGGGDVGFKVGDIVRCVISPNGDESNVDRIVTVNKVVRGKIKAIKEWEHDWSYDNDWFKLITITENKPTKNEMKRVRVLLINKDTDAVIFNEEMATEFSDADLKVLILLDKSAEIKKSLGGEKNVTLLHWEIKTITSYDKPEVK